MALVKWVGGEDDKKYTAGIMIDHIKNFDYEKFNNDEEDPDTVYVVEWHDTPKEPLGGWLCYNAKVIFVSHSIAVLNRKLRALDGVMSPRRVLEKVDVASSDASKSSNEIEGTKLEKKRNNSNEQSQLGDSDENLQLDCTVEAYELNAKTGNDNVLVILSAKAEEDEVVFVHEQVSIDNGLDSPTSLEVPNLDLQKNKIPEKTRSANKKQSDDSKASDKSDRPVPVPAYVTMDMLKEAMSEWTKQILPLRNQQLESQPSASKIVEKRRTSSVTEKPDLESMTELGNRGSNVFITDEQFNAAKLTHTPTEMATKTVKRRFKAAFKESDFNKAINVKCTKLRNSDNDNKKPKNDKKEDGSEDPKL
ncbi:hypothetical protein KQX54_002180 [Cotesia glomerata]|uniref:Uncharacterized protein n=1 Tax=Cotesia glomerata TaxID=32391 RepID=A0AAV7HUG5_COTGL|nr:hypothetical protein KQX54_002180 [Cotesia glomerata]